MKLKITPSKFTGTFHVYAGRTFVGNIFKSGHQFEAKGKIFDSIEAATSVFA